ncbi:MAG: hypothetical protein HQK65_16250 [Desulfamplus sp.]|nr:hypothetical protein [Desulfamplus sp.]
MKQVQTDWTPLWPSLKEVGSGDWKMPLASLSEPMVYKGKGQPFWVLEDATPEKLFLRGIQNGERMGHVYQWALSTWVDLFQGSAGPVMDPYADDDHGLRMDTAQETTGRGTRRYEGRSVSMRTLRHELTELLMASRLVWVTGDAGRGKSFLLHQFRKKIQQNSPGDLAWLPEGLHPPVVIPVIALPGLPLRSTGIAMQVNQALVGQPVYLPDGEPLGTHPERAPAWWRELVRINPGTRFLIIMDSPDEGGGSHQSDPMFHMLPPNDLETIWTIVAFRRLKGFTGALRHALDQMESQATQLDLNVFFDENPSGIALLRAYLKEKHKALKPVLQARLDPQDLPEAMAAGRGLTLDANQSCSFEDVLIAHARNRFLWVYHFARGLELGVLPVGMMTDWPAPENFYAFFLKALEQRSGNHPVYVDTFRRLLLTFSELKSPINDRTLLFLMHQGPLATDDDARLSNPEKTFALQWVEPILADLDDFLDRRQVSVATASGDDLAAAWILHDDARWRCGKRPGVRTPYVRNIAHATLTDYLQGDHLPGEWKTVRTQVRTDMRRQMERLFVQWELETKQQPGIEQPSFSAPVRYAQCFWPAHVLPDRDEPDGNDLFPRLLNHYYDRLPTDMLANRTLPFWIISLQQVVAVLRTRCGLPEGWKDEEVTESLKTHPGAVRELSIGLGRLGSALFTGGEKMAESACEVLEETIRLQLAFLGMAAEWAPIDAEMLNHAVVENPRGCHELVQFIFGHLMASMNAGIGNKERVLWAVSAIQKIYQMLRACYPAHPLFEDEWNQIKNLGIFH